MSPMESHPQPSSTSRFVCSRTRCQTSILWTKSGPSHQLHKILLQTAEQGSIEPDSVSTASNIRSRAMARIYIPILSSSILNYKPTLQGDSRTFIQGCYQLLLFDFTQKINELHWKKRKKKKRKRMTSDSAEWTNIIKKAQGLRDETKSLSEQSKTREGLINTGKNNNRGSCRQRHCSGN